MTTEDDLIGNLFGEDVHPEPLGATGAFPDGKLNAQDEGEYRLAITVVDERIIIEFSDPLQWLGLTADQAAKLGQILITRAAQITKKPIVISFGK